MWCHRAKAPDNASVGRERRSPRNRNRDISVSMRLPRLVQSNLNLASWKSCWIARSRPHLNNSPLESFERLLDERVILELVLIERHRLALGLAGGSILGADLASVLWPKGPLEISQPQGGWMVAENDFVPEGRGRFPPSLWDANGLHATPATAWLANFHCRFATEDGAWQFIVTPSLQQSAL